MCYEIVDKSKIKSLLPWKAPYYILIYSDDENQLSKQNIGFIFQQVDLFLQSKEIGTCWLGMASPIKDSNNQKFIITLAFGKTSQEIYRLENEFQRKSLNEISDYEDEKLIPAQFAPSAGNSQPWYFIHNDDGSYNIYQKKLGFFQRKLFEKWNPVDIGIALAHMYISNKDTFKFYKIDNQDKLKDYTYIGTFNI